MKDKLLPYVKQGYQFHIKNTALLNWFVDIEQRVWKEGTLVTYNIYINDSVKFYDSIGEALLKAMEFIDNNNFVKVDR